MARRPCGGASRRHRSTDTCIKKNKIQRSEEEEETEGSIGKGREHSERRREEREGRKRRKGSARSVGTLNRRRTSIAIEISYFLIGTNNPGTSFSDHTVSSDHHAALLFFFKLDHAALYFFKFDRTARGLPPPLDGESLAPSFEHPPLLALSSAYAWW